MLKILNSFSWRIKKYTKIPAFFFLKKLIYKSYSINFATSKKVCSYKDVTLYSENTFFKYKNSIYLIWPKKINFFEKYHSIAESTGFCIFIKDKIYLREKYMNHIKLTGSYISLLTHTSNSYIHLFIEQLPKLVMVSQFKKIDGILIDKRTPVSIKNYIKLMSKKLKIIEITKNTKVYISSLCYIKNSSFSFAFPKEGNKYFYYNYDKPLLKLFKKNNDTLTKKLNSKNMSNNLIYIDRSFRKPINNKEIIKYLKSNEFVIYKPEYQDICDQIRQYNSAKVVLFLGGGSQANLIFCQEGTLCICLYNDSKFNDINYVKDYVEMFNLTFLPLRCKSLNSEKIPEPFALNNNSINTDYHVNLRILKRLIKKNVQI